MGDGKTGAMVRGHGEAECKKCAGHVFSDPHVSCTNGMVKIECVDCNRRARVYPPFTLVLEDGTLHKVEWDEGAIERKPKLDGDLDDEKFVTVTLKMPKAVRGRLRYAGAIARVLNGIDAEGAWPVQVVEAIVEDYIQSNEHLVTGVSLEETDDGDFVAKIADGATTTQHERSESVRRKMTEMGTDQVAKATMALAEEEGALAGDDGGDGDEPTVADLDGADDGPLVSEADIADDAPVTRQAYLESLVNRELVEIARGHGLTVNVRQPKAWLVKAIIDVEAAGGTDFDGGTDSTGVEN